MTVADSKKPLIEKISGLLGSLQAIIGTRPHRPSRYGSLIIVEYAKETGERMRVIADFCIVPLGVGVSLSKYVAACEKVIKEAGLKAELHAYGTNVEGEWEPVMRALKGCHEVIHEMGAPRITTTVKLGTRVDRLQTMEEKVESVQEKLKCS